MSDNKNQSRAALRVPGRRFHGDQMSSLLLTLYMEHEKESAIPGSRTLFSYKLPDFQRPNDRWTRDQQVRFIESMYLGANIGAFMVNIPSRVFDDELTKVLLDGLQRLTALKAYFNSEFPVRGEDGVEYFWKDLTHEERCHLTRITFPWLCTHYNTRKEMMDAYERHNFSGTSHTAEDRADFLAKKRANAV